MSISHECAHAWGHTTQAVAQCGVVGAWMTGVKLAISAHCCRMSGVMWPWLLLISLQWQGWDLAGQAGNDHTLSGLINISPSHCHQWGHKHTVHTYTITCSCTFHSHQSQNQHYALYFSCARHILLWNQVYSVYILYIYIYRYMKMLLMFIN